MKSFEEVYTELNSVTMIITNKCNLSCDYCFERSKGNKDMSVDTAIEIVDRTYRRLPKEIGEFTYNLFGGEPLMNWDVVKAILDRIEEKHYLARVGITTNLTLLTDEMIDYIDDHNVFCLVSVDGIKEVHDAHRSNSFDKVIENIKKLLDRGLGHLVEARMTVSPDTAKYMYDGVKMLLDLGVNNICPIPASDMEWDEQSLKDFQESYNKMLNLYVEILNYKESTRNINIKHIDDIVGNVLEPEVTDTNMCNIGNSYWLCIDWDYNIYPCHNFPTTDLDYLLEMQIGNMKSGVDETKISFKSVQAKFELDRCKDCEAKVICKSGCPFQNLTENKDFFTPTESYCNLEKVLITEVLKFREKLLSAENIRSRKLNILIENLKVKEYLDNEVLMTPIDDFSFNLKLDRFMELYEALKLKGNVIPSFDQYISRNLAVLISFISGVIGEDITIVDK